MQAIPDKSVDLVVTSPPYDAIRDYKGFGLDLNKVGIELGRILKEGGICVIVIQDQTKNFRKSLTSFKTIVNWCENTEMDLFECVIYSRQGRPGAWWKTRFRVDHEYIPIFLKGKRPQYFDKSHLTVKLDHNWSAKGTTRMTDGRTLHNTSGNIGNTKTQGTIFHYSNSASESCIDKKIKLKHPATFPDKLAEDFIKCFCPENGIVLDPFMGSGTTLKMAKLNGRKFIGFEISQEYVDIANKRLAEIKD